MILIQFLDIGITVYNSFPQKLDQFIGPVPWFHKLKEFWFILNKINGHLAFPKSRMLQDVVQKGHICLNSTDSKFSQCPAHFSTRAVQSSTNCRYLDQHGIEKWRYGHPLINTPSIKSNTQSGGTSISSNHTIIRFEIVARILGGYPTLQCIARNHYGSLVLDLNLLIGKLIPTRYKQLGLDQVYIGNHFGHRMLNLNSWVYFNKIDTTVIIHQKFYRSYIIIVYGPTNIYGKLI